MLFGRTSERNAVILEEKRMVSEGLRHMLSSSGKFDEIKIFSSIEDATDNIYKNHYSYLFTEIVFNGTDIINFISRLRSKCPGLNIIIITSLTDIHAARRAFAAGANSFVTKYVGGDELINAINKNSKGEKYISSDLTSKFAISLTIDSTRDLTKREMEILLHVAQGFSIAKTASVMNLSQHTVITHRRNIMQKLKIHSAVEMARYAFSRNYLDAC